MLIISTVVALVVLGAGAVTPAAQTPTFEVASIKPNKTADLQSVPQIQPGGRVTLTNRTLRYLVQFAYSIESELHDVQIVGGPDWLNSERFDITAKMEGNLPPARETARMMLRALLVDVPTASTQ